MGKEVEQKYKKVNVLVKWLQLTDFSLDAFDFTFNTVVDGLCRISMAQSVSPRRFLGMFRIRVN